MVFTSEVPSIADKSSVPIVTAPVAFVFAGTEEEIYVPLAFVKLFTVTP